MNTSRFLTYQVLITGIRGGTPFLLLIYFTRLLNEIDLSNLVALWSLGNMVSGFLLMSSFSIAPQVFFKSSKFNKEELEVATYYQAFRAILLLLSSLILFLVVQIGYPKYTEYLSLLFYNNLYAVFPIWKYYSNRNLKNVLGVEILYKIPIITLIGINIILNKSYNLFLLFNILIGFGVIYILFDIVRYIKSESLKKEYITFVWNYFNSIFRVNLLTSITNAGQVYIISFFASPVIINQIAVVDKLKNLYLQLQGILISDRISKNRDILLKTENPTLLTYFSYNKQTIFLSLTILVTMFFLAYINVFDIIFNIEIDNYLILFILMINVFTSGLNLIFVSHVWNSFARIKEYKALYIKAFIIVLILAIPFVWIISYYAILLFGLLLDLTILTLAYQHINKKGMYSLLKII